MLNIPAAHLCTEPECRPGRENRAENPKIEFGRTKHRAENVTIIRSEWDSEWLLGCWTAKPNTHMVCEPWQQLCMLHVDISEE